MKYWHKNRLLKLVKLLRTKKVANHFNLRIWMEKKFLDKKIRKECGATACAVGWACTIPSFKKAGLKIYDNIRGYNEPLFRNFLGFDATAEFFGIDRNDATHLFHPDSYPILQSGPKDVANRIIEFLKNKSASKC